jgi:hypothetical protein
MNFIEIALSKKIKESEPTLDILGSDRKVFQVAVQDFMNYLNFKGFGVNKTNIIDQAKRMEQLQKEEPAEFEASLGVWINIWLRKWKERVNLSFGKQVSRQTNKVSENNVKDESSWTKLECKEEIIEIIASALIKNAEICGTQVIAENIVKTETCKISSKDINNKEQVLKILNNALIRARETAQRRGPLIAIMIDKRYYCEVNNQ